MAEIVDANRFRERAVAQSRSGDGGGNMDDVLRRLGLLETAVGELRVDVSAIKATLPHLATAADLNGVKSDIHGVRSEVQSVRAEIYAVETRIIRWYVGTTFAAVSAAFAIAKFVN